MATRTTYTSTITVPVYASWKCEKCGENNFAVGSIVCRRQETTSSWRNSKHKEAEVRAATRARAEWVGNAFKIIDDPNHSGSEMYNNLLLQNTKCTKCGKKPRWDKNAKLVPLVGLAIPTALISGIAAFSTLTSVTAWLIFLASAGFIAWLIAREAVHKRMMPKLPKQYTPVIGSLNPELIRYANALNKTIPTPDECIAAVSGYTQNGNASANKVQFVAETVGSDSSSDNTEPQIYFCRKCGTNLQADSVFCHKCGTEVVK